jgi:two-component system response regulator MprA
LIADDDRAIRESLVRALELEGYRITEVDDGVAALAIARREEFDVLVVDVMMPGVDGLEVSSRNAPRSTRSRPAPFPDVG